VQEIDFFLIFSLKTSGRVRIYLGKSVIVQEREESSIRNLLAREAEKHFGSSLPLIMIGLATYNPEPKAFTRQISSIRNQSYPNWICLVQDDHSSDERRKFIIDTLGTDERFIFHSNPQNLGFYRNFEAIIKSIPDIVPYVALCDQDDSWYPDKLIRLYQAFDDDTCLVHSDMRIVDGSGSLLSPSFWQGKVRPGTLDRQLMNNGITGASSMFREKLCRLLIPFPPDCGRIFNVSDVAFHDHWIGTLAMATGKIRFIPEPLYEYYQHGRNVAGHTSIQTLPEQIRGKISEVRGSGIRRFLARSYLKYLSHALQVLCMNRVILLRIPKILSWKRDLVEQVNCLLFSGTRLGLSMVKTLQKGNYTGDNERMLFFGYVSGKILSLVQRTPFLKHRV
jgi:glycosyltransferase involved in cell wall biosynthesis